MLPERSRRAESTLIGRSPVSRDFMPRPQSLSSDGLESAQRSPHERESAFPIVSAISRPTPSVIALWCGFWDVFRLEKNL
jgi:hypothetical protein